MIKGYEAEQARCGGRGESAPVATCDKPTAYYRSTVTYTNAVRNRVRKGVPALTARTPHPPGPSMYRVSVAWPD